MTDRARVQLVVYIAFLVFSGGVWISGGGLDFSAWRFVGLAVFLAVAALLAWEHYLWRTPLGQRMPGAPCCIRGTWQGTLKTLWQNAAGQIPPPKTVYLVVRQTATEATVSLLSDETTSRSTLAKVTATDGSSSFDYVYLDKPKPSVRHCSPIHHGSGSLAISGRPPSRMAGRYWTDRDSKGEVDFNARRKGLADDYEAAVALFQ